MIKFVQIESPYAHTSEKGIEAHIAYARLCMRDALLRGETPIASHLLYTQPTILNDAIKEERLRGMQAGFDLAMELDAVCCVYTDLGVSKGMERGMECAREQFRGVELRTLGVEFADDMTRIRRLLEQGRASSALSLMWRFIVENGMSPLRGGW